MRGCRYAIHLASPSGELSGADYSLITESAALDSALLRAAIDQDVQLFLYVSCACAAVPECDDEPADDRPDRARPRPPGADPPPRDSARAFAKLIGERLGSAAQAEHGLSFAVCRPPAGTPTDVENLAARIVAALS
jgi:nucleoside-diphosphate-sugar epimerase